MRGKQRWQYGRVWEMVYRMCLYGAEGMGERGDIEGGGKGRRRKTVGNGKDVCMGL